MQLDWFREASRNRLLINGIPLSCFAQKYNNFKSQANVLQFFKEVILKDFKGTPEQKAEAVAYLSQSFHLGGLLYPVSAAVATTLFSDKEGKPYGIPFVEGQNINIQTTEKGFVVQELCTFGSAFLIPARAAEMGMDGLVDERGVIKSQDLSKPLIRSEGTIEVDFSKRAAAPSLTVKSNTIEVNHPELAKRLDTRNFFQKFVDAVKRLFVEHISAKEPSTAVIHQHAIKEGLLTVKAAAAHGEDPTAAKHVGLDGDTHERGLC